MMTRRRNLLPLAGFLVCAIALVSYPTFFAGFEATRDVAWAWLLFALLKRLSASAEAPPASSVGRAPLRQCHRPSSARHATGR
jgi:hypothetical protein